LPHPARRTRLAPLIAASRSSRCGCPWAAATARRRSAALSSRAKWPHYAAAIGARTAVVAALIACSRLAPRARIAHRGRFGLARASRRASSPAATGRRSASARRSRLSLHAWLCARARAPRRFSGNVTIASIVVVSPRCCSCSSSIRSAARSSPRARRARQVRAGLAGERLLTADIWGSVARRRHALRRRDQFRAARDDRRRVSTLLGLVLRWSCSAAAALRGVLKVMSILPIITPPFVIALALSCCSGAPACHRLARNHRHPRSRWIY
jgi:hypothetical protein